LGPIYYRDSHGALLVYDITDNSSFEKVKNWVRELRKMLGNSVSIAIVGNKSDLERSRAVNNDEAEKYAQTVGAKHYSTSAKLNKGLDELFLDLAKSMLAIHAQSIKEESNGHGTPDDRGRAKGGEDVLVNFERQQKTGGCGCG